MTLKETRDEVAALMSSDGVTGISYVPARLQSDLAMVVPGNPYLSPGQTFGSHTLRLVVRLLSGTGDNETVTSKFDNAIERALKALLNDDWSIEEVTEPATIRNQDGSGVWLYTDISITDSNYSLT